MRNLKVIAILFFSSALITGCYDDSKNATVRINLGNIPIAKNIEKKSFIDKVFSVFVKDAYAQTVSDSPYSVETLHLAVYSEGKLFTTESFNGSEIAVDGSYNSYVKFDAPAGVNRTILVVGEFNDDGTMKANYFGSNTVDLAVGTTNDVRIIMNTEIGFKYDHIKKVLSWDYQGGKVKYIVKESNEQIIYSGYNNSIPAQDCTYYNIYITFEDFGIDSNSNTSTGQTYCP